MKTLLKYSLCAALFLCSAQLNAESASESHAPRIATDANIVGDVKDSQTGKHLPFITISIINSVIKTSTDATGHYFLKNLPVGKHRIKASAVGYRSVEKEVTTKAGEILEVNFVLEEENLSLNEVVVSANRNESERKKTTVVVGVLNPKLFAATNAVCLSQGLNFQPGVRMETNCQNCGFSQVRINGLEGPYSQILIDSRPIFSALSGVYGLEQIPVNMIERVEVVRGGGSALYGANAIAGTINIITKEAATNSFSAGYNLEYPGGKTPDHVANFNTSIVSDDNKAGLYLYGSHRDRTGYDHDNDGFTELPELKNTSIGIRSYYRINSQSKLSLEYHNLNEFRRGGNKLNKQAHEAEIAEQLNHDTNGGSLAYNWFSPDGKQRVNAYSSLQHVYRKSYYGGLGGNTTADSLAALNAYGYTSNLTSVSGAQYNMNIDRLLFMPSALTLGAEYQYDMIDDNMPAYRSEALHQKTHVAGFFIQNEWKNSRWAILLGARADKHNLLERPVISPRANIKFNILPDLHLRGSYSSGFRAPQTFDEDLHISFLGGQGVVVQNAPGLKPEFSNSFSASLDYYFNIGRAQANILLEGFHTRINDTFVKVPTTDAEGNPIEERRNGHQASVSGINIEGKIAPSRMLRFQFGYTYQQSFYSEAQAWIDDSKYAPEKRMLRTPDNYGYYSLMLEPLKRLQISATGTYTGSMLVPHMAGYIAESRLESTPQFFDATLKASYDIELNGIDLQLGAGVKNIFDSYQRDFDQGPNRDSAYIYGPGQPRSFFFSIKLGNIGG